MAGLFGGIGDFLGFDGRLGYQGDAPRRREDDYLTTPYGTEVRRPGFWGKTLALISGGLAPAAYEDLLYNRQVQRDEKAQTAAMRSYLLNQSFGTDFTRRGAQGAPLGSEGRSMGPGGVPAMANGGWAGPGEARAPAGMDAADRLLGVDPARAAQLGGAAGGAGAAGGGDRGSAGSAGSAGTPPQGGMQQFADNLLYNADGSLKSRQQLLRDPRYVAAQMDPTMAAMLAPYMDAAEARGPEWQFQNGQYFNVNSDDPTVGSRRVGTEFDNATGQYTTVNEDGSVNVHLGRGYIEGRQARERADNVTALERRQGEKEQDLVWNPQIERANAYAVIDPRLRQRERELQQDATLGAIAAGAREGATQAARAPYDVVTVNGPDGPITGTRAQIAASLGQGGPIQGLTDSQRTAQSNARSELATLEASNGRLNHYIGQIDRGELNLSLPGNIINRGLNWAGLSTRDSRNYGSFMAGMQGMMNESLRLNAGTQTDGDAQRAWREIFDNPNDERFVRQRLSEIASYNDRAIAERRARLGGGQSAPAPAARSGGSNLDAALAERNRRRGQ